MIWRSWNMIKKPDNEEFSVHQRCSPLSSSLNNSFICGKCNLKFILWGHVLSNFTNLSQYIYWPKNGNNLEIKQYCFYVGWLAPSNCDNVSSSLFTHRSPNPRCTVCLAHYILHIVWHIAMNDQLSLLYLQVDWHREKH